MDRPFMTWRHKDKSLDEKDKEIKRLRKALGKIKYDILNDYYKNETVGTLEIFQELYEIAQQALKEGE